MGKTSIFCRDANMEMQSYWLSILVGWGMSEAMLGNTQILSCSVNEKHVFC